MSARLAMRVLESALPKPLKPTAVVMALFGNDTGERIYPSVDRVAYLLGDSRRNVERNLAQLRNLGVLEPLTPLQGGRLPGGRGRSVQYRLNMAALPLRPGFESRHTRRGSEPANPDTSVRVFGADTPTPTANTPTPTANPPTESTQNPDTGVGGSIREILEKEREKDVRARARSLSSNGNYKKLEDQLAEERFDRFIEDLKKANPQLGAQWHARKARKAGRGGHS